MTDELRKEVEYEILSLKQMRQQRIYSKLTDLIDGGIIVYEHVLHMIVNPKCRECIWQRKNRKH